MSKIRKTYPLAAEMRNGESLAANERSLCQVDTLPLRASLTEMIHVWSLPPTHGPGAARSHTPQ